MENVPAPALRLDDPSIDAASAARLIEPPPETVTAPTAVELTVLPAADRLLPADRVTVPAKVMALKGLAVDPIVRAALKSGRLLTVIVSLLLPRLILNEPVGFAKSVVSNVSDMIAV